MPKAIPFVPTCVPTAEFEDVMDTADIADAIERINGNRPDFLKVIGDRLVREIRAVAKACRDWWKNPMNDAGDWLGLGLDVVTHQMTDFGYDAQRSRHVTFTRDALRAKITEMVEEAAELAANDDRHEPWDETDAAMALAWLDTTPYVLWRIFEEARDAGLDEFNDQLFTMAHSGEVAQEIGRTIQKKFDIAVWEWREAREKDDNG
jgi:hypothetical protein